MRKMMASLSVGSAVVFSLTVLFSEGSSNNDQLECSRSQDIKLVWIPRGAFTFGEDPQYPEEGPPRHVSLDGFWISSHEVTNDQFEIFVKSTGYVTLAERPSTPLQDGSWVAPGSAVFHVPTDTEPSWWKWITGANWRNPAGPMSDITGRGKEPVVQIAFDDAVAYARWAGLEIPTEEQWEYAARGGEKSLPEPQLKDGKPTANYYQGVFPLKNTSQDGFTGKAPVGCFPPNPFGLYDMVGNVWEWTSDKGVPKKPLEETRVIKGGSFLCAANYCARYRPAARQFQERGLGTDHIGIRLVDNNRPPPAQR